MIAVLEIRPLNVVYVTYDGLLNQLGATQVLPYVEGLADRGVAFTLISFEKRERDSADARAALAQRLAARRIRWIPLRYRKRPRVPATLLDSIVGMHAVRGAHQTGKMEYVHCRGDVAMPPWPAARTGPDTAACSMTCGAFSRKNRVETGSWARGGLVDRAWFGRWRRGTWIVPTAW